MDKSPQEAGFNGFFLDRGACAPNFEFQGSGSSFNTGHVRREIDGRLLVLDGLRTWR